MVFVGAFMRTATTLTAALPVATAPAIATQYEIDPQHTCVAYLVAMGMPRTVRLVVQIEAAKNQSPCASSCNFKPNPPLAQSQQAQAAIKTKARQALKMKRFAASLFPLTASPGCRFS